MEANEMCLRYMTMVLRYIIALKNSIKPKLVQIIQNIIEALATKAQVTSYNRKFYLSIKNKVKRKTTWEQKLHSKWKWRQKYEIEW